MTTDNILNPHELYPFNPKCYNINACAPALTQDSKLYVNRSKNKDYSHMYKLPADISSKYQYESSQSNANNNVGPLRVMYQRQGANANRAQALQIVGSTIKNNHFTSNNNTSQLVNSNLNSNRLNVSMLYSFI